MITEVEPCRGRERPHRGACGTMDSEREPAAKSRAGTSPPSSPGRLDAVVERGSFNPERQFFAITPTFLRAASSSGRSEPTPTSTSLAKYFAAAPLSPDDSAAV